MFTTTKLGSAICLIFVISGVLAVQSQAQSFDSEGFTTTTDGGFIRPSQTVRRALRDRFSPQPLYSHSNRGNRAGLTHQWNQEQAQQRTWHGNYGYWRYNQPTALVVPPTAAYQMSYGWGVGNNRSFPIHHQFGRGTAGTTGQPGGFNRTPLFPSHSDQFGVYSVRAPF